MPENVTPERTQLLRMYGAEIVYSEGYKGSNGAVEMALDMAEHDASYYMPYQYGNQANPGPLQRHGAGDPRGARRGRGVRRRPRHRRDADGQRPAAARRSSATRARSSPPSRCRASPSRACARSTTASSRRSSTSPARPQDLRHQQRRDRLDPQAARRGAAVRRRLVRRDRPRRGADRRRARRGQRRVHRLPTTAGSTSRRDLHAAARGDREPGFHRLVVSRGGAPGRRAEGAGRGAGRRWRAPRGALCGLRRSQAHDRRSADATAGRRHAGARRRRAAAVAALEIERRTVDAYAAGVPLLTSTPRQGRHGNGSAQELAHAGKLIALIRQRAASRRARADSYDIGQPRHAGAATAGAAARDRAAAARATCRWLPAAVERAGSTRAAVAAIFANDAQHLSMLRLLSAPSRRRRPRSCRDRAGRTEHSDHARAARPAPRAAPVRSLLARPAADAPRPRGAGGRRGAVAVARDGVQLSAYV